MVFGLPSGGTGLNGPQKAAILCMALGKEQSAKVMQLLGPNEVELVTREIASLRSVKTDVVDGVLNEYQEVSRAVQTFAQGGVEYAREILEAALGLERGRAILDRIRATLSPTALGRLKKAAPDMLLSVCRGEHPQTLALILAHLDSHQAAAAIEIMDPELGTEVLFRMARMDKVSPEMLALVETGLSTKTDLTLTQEMTLSGGPKAVAQMLNFTSPSVEQGLLQKIGERDSELAGQIKDLMFVFEDIKVLDGKAMQRVLRDVDGKELALALKVASDELKAHIFKNMSERAGAALREELEYMGAVRVKDVEAAHMKIVQAVRALQEAGEITIPGRGGEGDVVV